MVGQRYALTQQKSIGLFAILTGLTLYVIRHTIRITNDALRCRLASLSAHKQTEGIDMAKKNRTQQKSEGVDGEEGGDLDHTDDAPETDEPDTEGEGSSAAGDDADPDDFASGPPSGMVRRNANDASGWVAKIKGAVVYGQLLGRFSRSDVDEQGNKRYFYQIKLGQPCEIALPQDEQTDDAKTKTAKKGDVVNLDENKGLEGLKEAIEEGGIQVAWVKFKGKKRQQKDRRKTFWDIDAYTQKRNAPF